MFHINLASNAATHGDVWLYDETSGVAALGDLVTLPAPFLDTACPDGWTAALAQVATTPFALAIPGHGAPMAQAQFSLYRSSFESFVDCSKSARPAQECAANWASAVRSLLPQDPDELQRARRTAGYYIEMLRANSGRSKYCEAPISTGYRLKPYDLHESSWQSDSPPVLLYLRERPIREMYAPGT